MFDQGEDDLQEQAAGLRAHNWLAGLELPCLVIRVREKVLPE